ncbi:MAG: hypothetical protein WAT39_24515 [Planctomycetota bacterium]
MPKAVHLLAAVLTLLFAVVAAAQNKVLIPEKIERATAADDKGLQQWAEWKGDKCPNCAGTGKHKCFVCERMIDEMKFCIDCKRTKEREVVCRLCAGSGTLPDPLVKAPCPGCRGASFLLCTVCNGCGQSQAKDDNKPSACVACRGDGGWKCGACNGARFVEPAALKPSFKDASVKDLQKALAATELSLKELGAITPAGGDKSRKEVKALVKALEAAAAVHPGIKRLGKPFEDYMGKIYAGKVWQGWEEKEAQTIASVKEHAEYYLKHQKRMIELAHKRAEANEKLVAGQKGK